VSRYGKPHSATQLRENDRIGDAAAFAAARVAAVRDDPAGRLALARSIYDDPAGSRSQRPRFRRAALAFTRWMAERGVLDRLDGERPGSRWWRAPHNSSIVAAYLEHRNLAETENRVEASSSTSSSPASCTHTRASPPRGSHSAASPRVLDYAVIQPRLRPLYDWSAQQLEQPELRGLLVDDGPGYAWPLHDRHVWKPGGLSSTARAVKTLTAPR
jgi:hypothetical protein